MSKTETGAKKRKSIQLSQEEKDSLLEYRKKFRTNVECAEAITIDQNTLARVMLSGSGSPDTIAKIKQVLPMYNTL